MSRRRALAGVAGAAIVLTMLSARSAVTTGQTVQPGPAAPAGAVVGVGNFTHIVRNLDAFLTFYHDVIGLELTAPARPFDEDPAILNLANAPGAQYRFVSLKIPGSALGVEGVEYKDIDRNPVQPRFQDPGAANLILQVRDIDAMMARLTKAGVRFVTPGDRPAAIDVNGGRIRVVFVQDPDGFFVEIVQPATTPPAGVPTASNVVGGGFEIMIEDTDRTMRFYREALGFQPLVGSSFDGTKVLMETAGTPGAQFRRSAALIPGTSVQMAFLEFKDIDRKPLRTRFRDPGTAVLQLRVRDADSLMRILKAAGAEVVSADGQAVNLGTSMRLALVRDLNNLYLELIQTTRQ
jgi:catechol 2,3-dioxygenase-like lactoylglutathione lyase family enzyme